MQKSVALSLLITMSFLVSGCAIPRLSSIAVAGPQRGGDYAMAASTCEVVAARHGLVRSPSNPLARASVTYERPHDSTGPSLTLHNDPGLAARVSVTGASLTDGGRQEIASDVLASLRRRFGDQRVHYSEETWIEW